MYYMHPFGLLDPAQLGAASANFLPQNNIGTKLGDPTLLVLNPYQSPILLQCSTETVEKQFKLSTTGQKLSKRAKTVQNQSKRAKIIQIQSKRTKNGRNSDGVGRITLVR